MTLLELAPAIAALKPGAPLLGTLLAFEAGMRLQRRLGGAAFANPVLIAVALVASATAALGGASADYLAGVQPLPLFLGPATIALAMPLYRSLPQIRVVFLPVVVTIAFGAALAVGTALAVASLLGAPDFVVRAMATKTVTAAVAIAVAPQIGSAPSLAAGIAVLTGIIGAMLCTSVLDLTGVRDQRARGLATGIAAHGIGTARMLALDPAAGAFSGLAMSLTGLAGGIVLPLLFSGWAR